MTGWLKSELGQLGTWLENCLYDKSLLQYTHGTQLRSVNVTTCLEYSLPWGNTTDIDTDWKGIGENYIKIKSHAL